MPKLCRRQSRPARISPLWSALTRTGSAPAPSKNPSGSTPPTTSPSPPSCWRCSAKSNPLPSPSPETAPLPGQPLPSVLPQTGHLAPPFTRTDTTGKPFALAAARGRPLALFFFCGCPWCADVAQAWGRVQRGARLPNSARTVVVFAGDKAAASAFAAKNGLDLTQTLLLPDPDSKLTETVYHANSCPRTFVVNPQGIITYTNDHPDDLPRQAPAKTIVLHAFEALGQTQTGQSATVGSEGTEEEREAGTAQRIEP